MKTIYVLSALFICSATVLHAQNVGVGTTTPNANALLHVDLGINASKGFLVTGTYDAAASIPSLGAGSRMMFYPGKAAFRAGRVISTSWDNPYVGFFSTAFGQNTQASGESSTAIGRNSAATGNYATVIGNASTAAGENSFATGLVARTLGLTSISMGHYTDARGDYSIALGYITEAAGEASVSMGANTNSPGYASTAMGNITKIKGEV